MRLLYQGLNRLIELGESDRFFLLKRIGMDRIGAQERRAVQPEKDCSLGGKENNCAKR